jgi:hypothetical protein
MTTIDGVIPVKAQLRPDEPPQSLPAIAILVPTTTRGMYTLSNTLGISSFCSCFASSSMLVMLIVMWCYRTQ